MERENPQRWSELSWPMRIGVIFSAIFLALILAAFFLGLFGWLIGMA